jgi:hypothetical protein
LGRVKKLPLPVKLNDIKSQKTKKTREVVWDLKKVKTRLVLNRFPDCMGESNAAKP